MGKRSGGPWNIMRPLVWWVVLVLVLFGIRTHQRWMEQTRLKFTIDLAGRSAGLESRVALDGRPFASGERLSLGWHRLTITHPKAEPFTKNLFTLYGEQDLGPIDLVRAKGTLALEVIPRAAWLKIAGSEFTTSLTNSDGGKFAVPTGRYTINAGFARSEDSAEVEVVAGLTASVRIAPPLGALQISSSHSNTLFRLVGEKNGVRLEGKLPTEITQLPAGEYEVTADIQEDTRTKMLTVMPGRTNNSIIKFEYGAVMLDTDPPGVSVTGEKGISLGKTPLTLVHLRPGKWDFKLTHDDFETVLASLEVMADETNHFQTNLVNRHYVSTMRSARDSFSARDFDKAMEFAGESLKYKANDPAALALQKEATGLNHLANAFALGQRGALSNAMAEVKAALQLLPENEQAKQELASLTERMSLAAEREAIRAAVERAANERRERLAEVRRKLDTSSSRYKNSTAYGRIELTSTNAVRPLGEAIRRELRDQSPNLEIVSFEWPTSDTFLIDAKQQLADGLRNCVVVGGQIGTNETVICFKVVESQTSHEVNLLGGLLNAKVTTKGDRDGTRAAQFREQVRQGAPMVEARLLRAIKSVEASRQ